MGLAGDLAARLLEHDPSADPEQAVAAFIDNLAPDTFERLADVIAAEAEHERFNKFDNLFPDTGPLRRELYVKHLEHFTAGRQKRERLFMAGNRVGKTVAGGFEVTAHLTGRYPDWWEGYRFRKPGRWWVAGDTNETTRDILQLELLGEVGFRDNRKTMDGSGLIHRDAIEEASWKAGVHNLIDTIRIRHASGGQSMLSFKSYDQGRRAFQGTAKEGIWLDEEVPEDVYGECLMRLATTRGMLITTFTPLQGLTPLVLSFLPGVGATAA